MMETVNERDQKEKRRSRMTVTSFRRRVYDALYEVPSGCVTTYGQLAAAIGCRSARAVGGALRANPYAPRVPCHRVIAADLTPGGYHGVKSGVQVRCKLRRLAAEGVEFVNGRLADPSRLYHYG